jgi:hypothetical protein
VQGDGNIVIYKPNGVAWASNTHGMGGAVLKLQADCNLVEYSSSGLPIWSTGTSCY